MYVCFRPEDGVECVWESVGGGGMVLHRQEPQDQVLLSQRNRPIHTQRTLQGNTHNTPIYREYPIYQKFQL